MEITREQQKTLLKVARDTITAALTGEPVLLPPREGLYAVPCGAFVTLHEQGNLRGCIGQMVARRPLLETIQEMAHAAAFRDPRFPPLQQRELALVDLEISVLSPLEKLPRPEDLVPGVHGLYITRGGRSGVLLPQVATEQGWDRLTFLNHTCLKAGLPEGCWKDPETILEVFTARVFGEKDDS